jgi:predicted choloylglycine hydrolase
MNKKISVLFLSLLLLIFMIPITISSGIIKNIENKLMLNTINHLDDGYLEECDGVKILHLNGSYYNMGLQHGLLLKDETNANFRAFCNWIIERGFSYEELAEKWNIMKPYLPKCYIEEMEGVADGSGLSLENISVYNVGFYLVVNCGSFAAWGSAIKDGKLYHARSHDFPIKIKDPKTGIYLVETQVLIARKPTGFFSSVSPSEAGMVTASDGLNDMAIATGMLSSWTDDETLQGIDVGFRMRMVLDTASNITEALDIITSNKTLGYNFIVSDGKIPISYAVETTANLSYIGTWDNQTESTKPFWKIDYVVRRSNMFINTTTAETQR